MPILYTAEGFLVQSAVIARYVARKVGMSTSLSLNFPHVYIGLAMSDKDWDGPWRGLLY